MSYQPTAGVYEIPGIIAMASSGTLFTLGSGPGEVSNGLSNVQVKNDDKAKPWAPWTGPGGQANNLPIEMAGYIKKCGVLVSTIEAKARIGVGKGIQPVLLTGRDAEGTEQYAAVLDDEIEMWLEENNSFLQSIVNFRNLIGYGWSHQRIVLTNDAKQIAKIKTDPITKCRLGVKNITTGLIDKTFYAADWGKVNGPEEGIVKELPMLDEGNELADLQARIDGGDDVREFSVILRGAVQDEEYYPKSPWLSCIDWVKLCIQVPAMKVAMMNNQMSIKYIITISPEYFKRGDDKWDDYDGEKRQQKFQEKAQEINDHLVGTDKAFKSIVTGMWRNPVTGLVEQDIKIEVLDDKIKDGKLLPDSGAGNKEILFSLMMNPAIMGANTFGGDYSGGAGSGSDIREAYLVQIMLMEFERQMNTHIFNLVKRYNGWADKTYTVTLTDGTEKSYPGSRVRFRYPNLILTTLDTGGSTAPSNT